MKFICALLIFMSSFSAIAQSEGASIPQGTLVTMELTQEVREGKNKVGEAIKFIVSADVVVNDVVVIAKNTTVRANVTISKNRELRVDIYDVPAVDGTVVKLADCWIFTTAAQNLNSKGGLIIKGTKKNCRTFETVKIKSTNKQY